MTKTILAAALLAFGFGTAHAAEEYVTGYAAGVVSAQPGAAVPTILESNGSVTAPQAANSLPPGFEAGTHLGAADNGTVLGR